MNKVVAFIKSNDFFKSDMVYHGEYNGYVAVPPGNKYHGKSYFDINDVDVHGGITLSEPVTNREKTFMSGLKLKPEYVGKRTCLLDNVEFITSNTDIGDDWWILGFDTFHAGDNICNWSKKDVIEETNKLMEQVNKK